MCGVHHRHDDSGMRQSFAFTAAPLLVTGYALIRIVDGLDGERGPGPAWTIGHLAFLAGLVLFVRVFLELRRLAGRGAFATGTAVVALVGVACTVVQISVDLVVGALAADHDAMGEMFADVQALPGVTIAVYTVGPVLLFVGLLVLSCHLAVIRAVPAWRAAVVALGVLIAPLGLDLLPAVGLLLLAGLAPFPGRAGAPSATAHR
jgi:hypothetical protein